MANKVVVRQDEQKPVPVEVLAASIRSISDGIKKLRAGPLNDKAIVLLIQHAAPHVGGRSGYGQISTKEIRAVIEGMDALEATYLKRKPKA